MRQNHQQALKAFSSLFHQTIVGNGGLDPLRFAPLEEGPGSEPGRSCWDTRPDPVVGAQDLGRKGAG